ncbi:hypothetical protein KCP75_11195 [Salmonella enterica subsp. enterica]|nr:hypothetical protein KCP75_11195 [Salmonella enterica subsp. enterica]
MVVTADAGGIFRRPQAGGAFLKMPLLNHAAGGNGGHYSFSVADRYSYEHYFKGSST